METFDTNVVVRLLVEDDPGQCRRAEKAWRTALASGGVFLPMLVIVEISWVLRAAYGFDRKTTAAALRRIVDIDGVFVASDPAVRRVLASFERGPADLSDYLILDAAQEASALPVRSFDERFAQETNVEIVPPEDVPVP